MSIALRKSLGSSWSASTLALAISSLITSNRPKPRTGWQGWRAQASSSRNSTWSKSRSRRKCLKTDFASWTMKSSGCRNKSRLRKSTQSSQIRWSRGEKRIKLWWIGIRWTWSKRRRSSAWSINRGVRRTGRAFETTRTECLSTTRARGKISKLNQARSPIIVSRWSMTTNPRESLEPITAWTWGWTPNRTLITTEWCTTMMSLQLTRPRPQSMHESVKRTKTESSS